VWVLYPFEQLFLEALLTVQGINARAYISTLDPSERQALQRDFNEPILDPEVRSDVEVLVASYYTNGVGLNLHHDCASCHLLDQPPSQAARQQAIGRTYRLGQKRTVEVVEYNLIKSFDINQLSRVTKRALPAAMSFLDLERLGVPEAAAQDEAGFDDASRAAKAFAQRFSGLWALVDGTVIHESDGKFNDLMAAGALKRELTSAEDLLHHLLNLSRGEQMAAHGRLGETFHNASLDVSLTDRIEMLRSEIQREGLNPRILKIRKAQLRDLEERQAELEAKFEARQSEFAAEDLEGFAASSTPKKRKKHHTSEVGPANDGPTSKVAKSPAQQEEVHAEEVATTESAGPSLRREDAPTSGGGVDDSQGQSGPSQQTDPSPGSGSPSKSGPSTRGGGSRGGPSGRGGGSKRGQSARGGGSAGLRRSARNMKKN